MGVSTRHGRGTKSPLAENPTKGLQDPRDVASEDAPVTETKQGKNSHSPIISDPPVQATELAQDIPKKHIGDHSPSSNILDWDIKLERFAKPEKDDDLVREYRHMVATLYQSQSQVAAGVRATDQTTPPLQGSILAFEKKHNKKLGIPLGSAFDLLVDDEYGHDNVWLQLDDRNKAAIPALQRACNFFIREIDHAKKTAVDKTKEKKKPVDDVDGEEKDEAIEVAEQVDSELLGTPIESDELDLSEEEDEEPTSKSKSKSKKKLAEPKVSSEDEEDEEEPVDDDDDDWEAYRGVEDDFFKVKNLAQFVSDAETLYEQGKLYDDENPMETDSEADDDDDDGDEEALDLGMELDDDDDDDDDRKAGKRKRGDDVVDDDDADFGSDDEDERVRGNRNQIRYSDFFDKPDALKSKSGNKKSKLDLFGDANDDENDEEGGDEEDAGGMAKSVLAKQYEQLQAKIARLETEALGEKNWDMRGEIRAQERPLNSLLDAKLEHETILKSAPVITEDITLGLEHLIRRRILEYKYDDVIPKISEHELEERRMSKKKNRSLAEISQEKPQIGLGEQYEKEYLAAVEQKKQALGASQAEILKAAMEMELKGKPEYMEIHRLFKDLCEDLDMLSSLHYVPKPVKLSEEMKVRPNVSALVMEEAMPEGVSDVALVAPGEVYAKSARLAGAATELSKEERHRLRKQKKRAIRSRRKGEEKHKILVAGASGANGANGANGEHVQSAGKAIRSVKQLVSGQWGGGVQISSDVHGNNRDKSKNLTNAKSGEYFSRLQETVRKDIELKK